MNHQAHESARLITEADRIKADVARLSVEKFEIDAELRRLAERFEALNHTYGTVNSGQRMGWGVPS